MAVLKLQMCQLAAFSSRMISYNKAGRNLTRYGIGPQDPIQSSSKRHVTRWRVNSHEEEALRSTANREVWDSKICHLIPFISLKKVLHCDLITSNSKMPLVDSSEDGERYSFRLRRIGIPATYPGIGNTFKWVGTAELSCFNTVHVLRKHTRTIGSLNRNRSKLWVRDRRSVVFMRSHVKDLCMRIIQLIFTLMTTSTLVVEMSVNTQVSTSSVLATAVLSRNAFTQKIRM